MVDKEVDRTLIDPGMQKKTDVREVQFSNDFHNPFLRKIQKWQQG